MDQRSPSQLSNLLISTLERQAVPNNDKKITVNQLVSEVATWYEKLRTAMDYREEEVILRASIERILKRRLLLTTNGKKIAPPLVRELVWARYFPDASVPETIIEQVAQSIDLHLALQDLILKKHKVSDRKVHEWILHILSSDLTYLLSRDDEKQAMANFMFQVMRENVVIEDDTSQNRDVQIFIAVRQAFARDDIAFLRYHLFLQIFGKVEERAIDRIATSFKDAYKEINDQIHYPRKDAIYSYVQHRTPPFLILFDVLRAKKQSLRDFIQNKEALTKSVFEACEARYQNISGKVKRAIIRSVIFILFTKTIFAFTVEGTYESLVYKKIIWGSIALNTLIPPMLMIVVGLFIRTPDKNNSRRILVFIERILFEEKPLFGNPLVIKRKPEKNRPVLEIIFGISWLLAFAVSFGAIIYVLSKLQFNIVSQGIFLFFLAIVSFLSYRIYQIAHVYTVSEPQGILTPIIDFLFLPIVQVGRRLTEGIAQINFILFVFDFLIEMPFKGLFGFFEQWFLFLHSKREELG